MPLDLDYPSFKNLPLRLINTVNEGGLHASLAALDLDWNLCHISFVETYSLLVLPLVIVRQMKVALLDILNDLGIT